MKGCTGWSYAPYQPFDRRDAAPVPYICRLAPYEDRIELEWLDKGGSTAPHSLFYAVRGSGEWKSLPVSGNTAVLTGLQKDAEYELYISREDGVRSNVRLARTGTVPGTVVNYLHPEDGQYDFVGQYLCSPAITRLADGSLFASMDVFRGDGARNLSLLFRSEDEGRTWQYLTDLFPCFWGTPFVHRGRLYMLACSNKYGDLLLGWSDDGGRNWGSPVVLMRGACCPQAKGFHRAPMPVICYGGRLRVAVDFGGWECGVFGTTMVSADEDADLTDPASWTLSPPLDHDRSWPGAENTAGGLESNAVPAPDGSLAILLRYAENKALLLGCDPDRPDERAVFRKIMDFPMGHTKFEVRRHPDGSYYAVGNTLPGRNVLALYRSEDLEHWEHHSNIVNYSHAPLATTGFQYPSFMFDGEDEILVLSRSAFNGADTFHNNNYVTFHRVKL